MLVAETAIDLAAARGVIARAASLVDDSTPRTRPTTAATTRSSRSSRKARRRRRSWSRPPTRIVDRALALSGGAGYLNGSPLARAYRDVRAGAFMHPLGANRAYGFLARTALGLRPHLT